MSYYAKITQKKALKRGLVMKYILFNPLSGDGESESGAISYSKRIEGDYKIINITELGSYADFVSAISEDDEVYLFGGDGTINKFANGLEGAELKTPVYYYPSGTGNDFATDVDRHAAAEPFRINEYLTGLPTVTVKDKSYKFINGVGYGIDGYCCEVGDKMKEEGKKPNYTSIAIKGLLFSFKPRRATVTVDGVTTVFEKVWIAPTMFGRRYGGGMIPTPEQKRGGDKLSLMVFHGSSKLKTLMIFPSIFKGEHVKEKKFVTVIEGKDITVRFDSPSPLQIDGETILNVTSYSAKI